ncbi:probable aminopeptidase NPEPL1 isoform X2 [Leucoraja erinacea]|uniref:probable aminopeptidase NPEPL1 isoform X2 n=1 Tax=Leucoraja erinaceus TaxID=7782 RepID=UPI002455A893|nr:probable aminopeptidase NPEPL1 isoform X2 [Leucoraja erinacea]
MKGGGSSRSGGAVVVEHLTFTANAGDSDPRSRAVLFAGQLPNLHKLAWSQVKGKLEPRVTQEVWKTALRILNPNPVDTCSLWLKHAFVAALPAKVSRHNSPSSAQFLTRLICNSLSGKTDQCIVLVCEYADVFALACALARAFPLFTRRTGLDKREDKLTVTVQFILVGENIEPLCESTLACLSNAAEGIRLAARIVDMPCCEMNTDDFLVEINLVGSELGIIPTIIRGEELNHKGFGGIYGVGKAAMNPPALAILSHTPEDATQTIAWVGKGIVYDTGGLSIKSKTHMPGMKRDCGGAAAVLGAFRAAVKQGFKENLHALFCLAENAVGAKATRPDDIHRLYSGKTVEINNTDAEGRLVLADGVCYACKDLKADIILDIATLTGAQDRANAASSRAGLFIQAHIGFDWPGVWVHIDMASTVHSGARATGYGVALLLALFGRATDNALLKIISPVGVNFATEADDAMENCLKKRRHEFCLKLCSLSVVQN